MTAAPDFGPALEFLSGLERNNNKPWFEAHRPAYEAARQTFEAFVQYFGPLSGARLLTAPQGYARDHPEIELLKHKEVTAVHHLPEETVCAPELTAQTLKVFKAIKPFLDYLNEIAQ